MANTDRNPQKASATLSNRGLPTPQAPVLTVDDATLLSQSHLFVIGVPMVDGTPPNLRDHEGSGVTLDHADLMPRTSGIYRIRHIQSGRIYIGSSRNLQERLLTHYQDLLTYSHYNKRLQRAFRYDPLHAKGFTIDVIEFTIDNVDQLVQREQYWINLTHCTLPYYGYNVKANANYRLSEHDDGPKWTVKGINDNG